LVPELSVYSTSMVPALGVPVTFLALLARGRHQLQSAGEAQSQRCTFQPLFCRALVRTDRLNRVRR
jgi:hypothetical protein